MIRSFSCHSSTCRNPAPRHSHAGGNPAPRHSRAGGNPAQRHSRAGGNPVITRTPLDSRLRGNDDPIAALDAERAEALINIKALL